MQICNYIKDLTLIVAIPLLFRVVSIWDPDQRFIFGAFFEIFFYQAVFLLGHLPDSFNYDNTIVHFFL